MYAKTRQSVTLLLLMFLVLLVCLLLYILVKMKQESLCLKNNQVHLQNTNSRVVGSPHSLMFHFIVWTV